MSIAQNNDLSSQDITLQRKLLQPITLNTSTPHHEGVSPLTMDAHAMYYPHDLSGHSSPSYTVPQEVFFANPAFASANSSFMTQPDYAIPEEFNGGKFEQNIEFPQPPMIAAPPFMSPTASFDGTLSQSSSTTSLVNLSSNGSIRGHPVSPSGSGYRGIQRFSPYSTSRPKNKRTGVACDPCRAKKQKCDGQKRCHQCVTNNLECKYREIEPKTSGNVVEQIARLAANCRELMQDLNEKLDNIDTRLRALETRTERMQFRCQRCNHVHVEAEGDNAVSSRL